MTEDEILDLCQETFSPEGIPLQKRYTQLNNQFFDGKLPRLLIIVGNSEHREKTHTTGFLLENIIYIERTNTFNQTLILLHEMQHAANRIKNVYDYDHGLGWVESLAPILEQLNISSEVLTRDFTESDAIQFPRTFFDEFELTEYFKRNFAKSDRLIPLPTNMRSVSRRIQPEVQPLQICKCCQQLIQKDNK